MMNKRGALFFTLDTLIAGVILAFTIVLILNSGIDEPRLDDTRVFINTLTDYLTITRMDQVGQIIYPFNVQQEQITQLYVHEHIHNLYIIRGEEEKAQEFVENIINTLIPDSRGVIYQIDEETIYYNNNNIINPRINLTYSFITYYTHNGIIQGPNITRIAIWI